MQFAFLGDGTDAPLPWILNMNKCKIKLKHSWNTSIVLVVAMYVMAFDICA